MTDPCNIIPIDEVQIKAVASGKGRGWSEAERYLCRELLILRKAFELMSKEFDHPADSPKKVRDLFLRKARR